MTESWWTDHRNLARLARYLVREEGYDAGNLVEFLGDPWSRQPEWDAMLEAEKEEAAAFVRTLASVGTEPISDYNGNHDSKTCPCSICSEVRALDTRWANVGKADGE